MSNEMPEVAPEKKWTHEEIAESLTKKRKSFGTPKGVEGKPGEEQEIPFPEQK